MSTIYLLHYNNYYNRIVKKEDDINDYLVSPYLIATLSNVNFNPNDGVDTELIIGTGAWDKKEIPDYLIEWNDTDDYSRWFVLECSRTRSGQYKLILKRDVIADNYEAVVSAPCYIEKATLPDTNNLIFNQETDSFNQIKTSETLLKDTTNIPWIVGYLSSKDADKDDGEITPTIEGVNRGFSNYDLTYSTKESFWQAYTSKYNTTHTASQANLFNDIYGDMSYDIKFDSISAGRRIQQSFTIGESGVVNNGSEIIFNSGASTSPLYITRYLGSTETNNSTVITRAGNAIANRLSEIRTTILPYMENQLKRNSIDSLTDILENNGKVVYISGTNEYFKIAVTKTPNFTASDVYVNGSTNPTLSSAFNDLITDYVNGSGVLLQTWHYEAPEQPLSSAAYVLNYNNKTYYNYHVQLTKINLETVDITLPSAALRPHLNDAPYDMFCMPYGSCKFYSNGTEKTLAAPFDKATAFNIAMAMSAEWAGVGFIYDIQLLPYCPLNEEALVFNTSGEFQGIELGSALGKVGTIAKDNNVYGYIPFLYQSKFEINLDYSINIDNYKVQNQTDLWRLCSPNYGSYFDFNAAKNGGVVNFNVDCQYKPYTPYIHINPKFNRLYGNDYNDPRGLICGNEFSLPMITDQWETYQYQNKNYQNIFDRQIQNMDVNHKIDKTEAIWSGIAGIGTGAASGAFVGNLIGGSKGGFIGAGIGAATSAVGMGIDLANLDKRYNESKSFATDTFNMQLGNIQALPNTLTRVSSFNNNNKIFPVLEYYTCTPEEKQAFENKLYYNGMTVNVIGSISQYQQPEKTFMKGRIIRLELEDDTHMLQSIANEIAQGVYI